MIERFFQLKAHGTDVKTEIVAGLTTFVACAYIVLVNPAILADAGIDPGAAFMATCFAAALGSLLMGFVANFPVAIAPGMGLNAFFTYGVVIGMGVAWQTALGVTFIAGLIFVLLSVTPARAWIIDSIPKDLKLSIAAGVGFFLVIIGLTNSGFVVDNPATLVALGDIKTPELAIAGLTFLLIAALDARGVPGAVLIGIVVATAVGAGMGLVHLDAAVATPPSIAPTLFALDIPGALDIALVSIIISFVFVDLFDTSGTLFGIAHKGGFLKKDGSIPRMRRVLVADSVASLGSAVLGTSPATSYIESAAGVRVGGRTGLVAVTVGVLFLACIFFAPLASAVPSFATGPALVYVGCMLASALVGVDWKQAANSVAAIVTALTMPLTYSISNGIGFGTITFAVLLLATGQTRLRHVGLYAIALAFVLKFALL